MTKISHVGHLLHELWPVLGKFFHGPASVFGKLFHHLEPVLDKVHGGPTEALIFALMSVGLLAVIAAVAAVVVAGIVLGIKWLASLAVMLLGTIKASKDSQRNSTAKIRASGVEASYKGSPWLLVAAVGGLMLILLSIKH